MSADVWPVGFDPAEWQLVESVDITDEQVLRAVFGDDLIDLALSARGARLKRQEPPLAIDGHAYRQRQRNRVKRRR